MGKVDLNWIMCRIDEIKEKVEYRIRYDVDTPIGKILTIVDEANKYWNESMTDFKKRWGG